MITRFLFENLNISLLQRETVNTMLLNLILMQLLEFLIFDFSFRIPFSIFMPSLQHEVNSVYVSSKFLMYNEGVIVQKDQKRRLYCLLLELHICGISVVCSLVGSCVDSLARVYNGIMYNTTTLVNKI